MASKSKPATKSADAEWIEAHAPYVEEVEKDKKQQTPIIKPEPALVELQRHPLTSRGEPHARYQQIIKELAQARLDKKKKKSA